MQKKKRVLFPLIFLMITLLSACSSVSSLLPSSGDPAKVKDVLAKVKAAKQTPVMINYHFKSESPEHKAKTSEKVYKIHYVDDANLRYEKVKHISQGQNFGWGPNDQPDIYIDGVKYSYDDISDEIDKGVKINNVPKEVLDRETYILNQKYYLDRVKKHADKFTVEDKGDTLYLSGTIEEVSDQEPNEDTALEKMLGKEKSMLLGIKLITNKGTNGVTLLNYRLGVWIDKKTHQIKKIESTTEGEIPVILSRKDGYVFNQEGKKVLAKEILTYKEAPNKIAKPKDIVTPEEKSDSEYH